MTIPPKPVMSHEEAADIMERAVLIAAVNFVLDDAFDQFYNDHLDSSHTDEKPPREIIRAILEHGAWRMDPIGAMLRLGEAQWPGGDGA